MNCSVVVPLSSRSLAAAVTSTWSGRSARNVPRAIASFAPRDAINCATECRSASLTRLAIPRLMMQAEPSLTGLPSAPRAIFLLNGPSCLTNEVRSNISTPTVAPLIRSNVSGAGSRSSATRAHRPASSLLGSPSTHRHRYERQVGTQDWIPTAAEPLRQDQSAAVAPHIECQTELACDRLHEIPRPLFGCPNWDVVHHPNWHCLIWHYLIWEVVPGRRGGFHRRWPSHAWRAVDAFEAAASFRVSSSKR